MNCKDYFFSENKYQMNYKVFFPNNCEDLPLVVYLHGAGERGTNISHLYRHGIPKMIFEGMDIPAVVLCPQCPETKVWDNIVDRVKEMIDDVAQNFRIQKDRISITGSSMGGFGTWMMGMSYPGFFSAMAPVAGGGMSWRASNLRTTPIRAFHGSCDTAVPSVYSELMDREVQKYGGCADMFLLDGMEHNDGIDYAYRSTDLIDWLLKQRRCDFSPIAECCSRLF